MEEHKETGAGQPAASIGSISDAEFPSTEQEVRLECLKLALRGRGAESEAGAVITDAGRFADFVLRGEEQSTGGTTDA